MTALNFYELIYMYSILAKKIIKDIFNHDITSYIYIILYHMFIKNNYEFLELI